MNICFIITKADEIGGAQIHVRDIARKLTDEGHVVTVIVGEPGALVDDLNSMNISVIIINSLVREISPINDICAIVRLRHEIKKLKPDLISLHSSKAGMIGRLSTFLLGVPIIFTAHGWAFANGVSENRKKIYCIIERILSKLAKKIITVSQQDKDLAIKYKVSNDRQQIVIHNGMPEIESSLINNQQRGNDVIKLISVARFSEQKDHRTLFLALSQLMQFSWELTLVGKGPLLMQYQQMATELGIENRIKFVGERHDVAIMLSHSDIFLLISNWEGFPRSILEAMRGQLPVIASDVGGVSEAVINNETGYLIPRKDVQFLRDKLELLLLNKDLREQFGKKGRELFVKNFTFESMYVKTTSLYKSVINNQKY